MADISSDLELLVDIQEVGSDENLEEERLLVRRTQRRAQYQLDRSFATNDEFGNWWNNEGSAGWNQNTVFIAGTIDKNSSFHPIFWL